MFEDAATVSLYADKQKLMPSEAQVFEHYVRPGSDILDLGVGAGRTTPYLSREARSYVGVDYAEPMVEVCRARFPDLTFHVADASDLHDFDDHSFDVVVFSFNGIDYMSPAGRRERCLTECRRVLRDDGVLIVSRHNPRAIVQLPSAGWLRSPGTTLRAIAAVPRWTLRRTVRMAIGERRVFWSGQGTIVEPAQGFNAPLRLGRSEPTAGGRGNGLVVHMATPRLVRRELGRLGFEVVAVVGSTVPRYTGLLVTPWYYYVAVKQRPGPQPSAGRSQPSTSRRHSDDTAEA